VPVDDDLMRSPRNQLYQFAVSLHGTTSADNVNETVRSYLWIPEHCKRLRGLLIFAENVPEGLIAGDAAIRKVCADNDLGIYYSVMSFCRYELNVKAKDTEEQTAMLLQANLSKLADLSGYSEVATVPWLPIGESMSLLMVGALTNAKPERCMAAIYSNDVGWGKHPEVPVLAYQGTSSEWTQRSGHHYDWNDCDIKTWWKWNSNYKRVCGERQKNPKRPLSMVQYPGGHFNCTAEIIRYYALYIDAVAKARLSDDGSPRLKPVDPDDGYLARLPVYQEEGDLSIDSARGTKDISRPWFFSHTLAAEAQRIARIDWNAQTQVPMVEAGEHCLVHPWAHNDVTEVDVASDSEFSLKPVLLEKIPDGFLHAGEPLAKSVHQPTLRWLRGMVVPLGGNRFRIELDRNYRNAEFNQPPILAASVEGDERVRYSIQPIMIRLIENTHGTLQTIQFEKIADVPAGTPSVPLRATASSGLPVRFYVDAGPAIVEDNRLKFTRLPPKTKFPAEVTVVAWQWGTGSPPLFSRAITWQTFRILK